MTIRTIGVAGAGMMGTGIAIAAALAGYRVTLIDIDAGARASARERIRTGCQLLALVHARERKHSPDTDAVLGQITLGDECNALVDADFVIECASENVEIKEALYSRLDECCLAHAIFASNTSCIPIDRIAGWTGRPDRIIGTHFMNPAQIRVAVEVIRGPRTSSETIERTRALLIALGKSAVVVNDAPGFVINRVLMVAINEAIGVVQEGIASAADVDALFVNCLGHKTGPLATADLIGLDVIRDSLIVLRDCYGSSQYEPKPLLDEMVASGRLGNKSGAGFF